METLRIFYPQVVTPSSFGALMHEKGAYLTTGVGGHHCLQRNDAAVYLSLENEADRDIDSLERVKATAVVATVRDRAYG
jgi:hypothetical protein